VAGPSGVNVRVGSITTFAHFSDVRSYSVSAQLRGGPHHGRTVAGMSGGLAKRNHGLPVVTMTGTWPETVSIPRRMYGHEEARDTPVAKAVYGPPPL